MTLAQIAQQALALSEAERAELAQRLLLSLDDSATNDIADEWLAEASRRARELDSGVVQPIPAEDVRRKAMALLR